MKQTTAISLQIPKLKSNLICVKNPIIYSNIQFHYTKNTVILKKIETKGKVSDRIYKKILF